MAIQREIWQDHIEGNLFKNNEFLLASTDAGQYVLQGKVVHIPQAGAGANVEKNRTTVPATVIKRDDNDVTYSLDEYTTDPILIPGAEAMELSYNKRESVLYEYESSLRQVTADNLLQEWAPSIGGNIIRTTGTAVSAHLPSATGNRKKLLTTDLKNAQLQMNKQNVPLEDRYALLSADMLQQLTDGMDLTAYRDYSNAYDAKNGILGMLYGFKIMMRSTVLRYDNSGTPALLELEDDAATTDNDAVLCWQVNAVERAVGQISFFEQLGHPQFYGDVYSLSVRMGGRKRRNDEKGIIAIVQASTT